MHKELLRLACRSAAFMLYAGCVYFIGIGAVGTMGPDYLKRNINYLRGAYGHMYSRLQEVKNTANIDVLIVGSSHAYRGFDPRIFAQHGISMFNLGSSQQTPLQTEVLLRRYIEETQPGLVMLEVYTSVFTVDGVEAALDLISNDRNDLQSIVMALRISNLRVYNTLFYVLFRDLLLSEQDYVEDRVKGDDFYVPGGYVEKAIAYNESSIPEPGRMWIWNKQQWAALNRIRNYLDSRNIGMILVQAPVTVAHYNAYQNNDEFNSLIAGFGAYYDFNGAAPLDDHLHFYDSHHLNQDGVSLFNTKLIKMLLQPEGTR